MKIKASSMLLWMLVSIESALAVSAKSVLLTAAVQPDSEEITPPAHSIQFSAGIQQKAAGDLAVRSIADWTWAQDLSTISLLGLCINNYSFANVNDVWVEIWASKQKPQIGGDLTHLTVASHFFGTVPLFSYKCLDTGAIPMTPPDPGLYWLSNVVWQGAGSGRILHFVYTDSAMGDFGGPFVSVSGARYFEKPISHYITNGGNTASLQVGRIRNTHFVPTGQLKLSLKATVNVPRFGEPLGGTFAEREYAPLNGSSYYSNVDTGALVVDQPPADPFRFTLNCPASSSLYTGVAP